MSRTPTIAYPLTSRPTQTARANRTPLVSSTKYEPLEAIAVINRFALSHNKRSPVDNSAKRVNSDVIRDAYQAVKNKSGYRDTFIENLSSIFQDGILRYHSVEKKEVALTTSTAAHYLSKAHEKRFNSKKDRGDLLCLRAYSAFHSEFNYLFGIERHHSNGQVSQKNVHDYHTIGSELVKIARHVDEQEGILSASGILEPRTISRENTMKRDLLARKSNLILARWIVSHKSGLSALRKGHEPLNILDDDLPAVIERYTLAKRSSK